MSGYCTPLPLIWQKLSILSKARFRRTTLDLAGGLPKIFGIARGAKMGSLKTLEIADKGFIQNQKVFDTIYSNALKHGRGRRLLTPMMAIPMDMGFAHLDGYAGKPIYNKVLSRQFYYEIYYESMGDGNLVMKSRKIILWPEDVGKDLWDVKETRTRVIADGLAKADDIHTEKTGYSKQVKEGFYYYLDRKNEKEEIHSSRDKVPRWFHGEEMDMYVEWKEQVDDTITAAVTHPFQYIPLYHYDPRRWMNPIEGHKEYDDPETQVICKYPWGWDIPFEEIATAQNPGVFIGFKMYTALGYRPDDYKVWGCATKGPRIPTLKQFYARCQTENIPILCHCSPGGINTHDFALYFELENSVDKSRYMRGSDPKNRWFYDSFVRPEAWEPVLRDFPHLKLCLAHFGGDTWAEWRNNTFDKTGSQEGYGESPKRPVTDADIDRFISDWYHKPEEPGKYNWIRQLVDLMEKKDKEGADAHPNLYTDISYHFIWKHQKEFVWLLIHHPIAKKRVLFGTDWYMTELDSKSIESFVAKAKKAIDGISQRYLDKTGVYEDFWETLTRTNPMAFYGLRSVADKFAAGLKMALKKNVGLDDKAKSTSNSMITEALEIIKNSDEY